MKLQFRSVFAALAVAAAAVGIQAQPALKVATVDMDQLFNKFYKTEAQQAKLEDEQKKAGDLRDSMLKERETLVGQAKELQEQATNALLNDEARKKAESDLQKKIGEVRAKENEIQGFVQQTQQQLRAVFAQFQQQAVEEITKVASDIAKKKGVTMVINQGVLIYADSTYSITDEVLAAINKDRPVAPISITTPATPAAAPAPAAKK